MQSAFNSGMIEPKERPHYQLASCHGTLLQKLLIGCGCLVGLLMTLLWQDWMPGWKPVLVTQTAMLLVLAASVQSVWWLTRWRAGALRATSLEAEEDCVPAISVPAAIIGSPKNRWQRSRTSVRARFSAMQHYVQRQVDLHGAAFSLGLLTALTLLLITRNWNPQPPPIVLDTGAILLAAVLMVLAFVLLVLERYYLSDRAGSLPEAPQLAYQLRVSITVSLLLCTGILLSDGNRPWPAQWWVWSGLLPAAIAVELLLRVMLSLFAPPQREPELLARSLLTALWRWPPQPLRHLQDELRQRFGIDLRQSWAFAYIRRALLPVVASLLAVAWLLTGLFEIPVAARGIYERFGSPVAVWQSGFQVGLPWPLGQLRLVENGVVHELAIASAGVDETAAGTEEPASAEGPPPAGATRLWDASHVAEKSQLIASEISTGDGNRQSFQIVNMDVRVMYRIGLSDTSALKARYNSADVPALIRSTANRILVRYFASRTLEGVLGERRTQLAQDIGAQLQQDLDVLDSGVEIMTTVVESIHPPAAAANSYHAVQASQINAQAIIARERGNAAEQVNLAQLRASMTQDQASAAARETLAGAEAAARRFAAEREAFEQGGRAFLQEQYYARLTQGLSEARLVLVDHRLGSAGASIDLRNFAAPLDAPPRPEQ